MTQLSIANDFSDTPSGVYLEDGVHSAERLREELLVPALKKSSKTDPLVVDLYGTECGYGSSYLKEAFGGLVSKGYFTKQILSEILIVKGADEHSVYKKSIQMHIENAENETQLQPK